jgi:hypothetical protein
MTVFLVTTTSSVLCESCYEAALNMSGMITLEYHSLSMFWERLDFQHVKRLYHFQRARLVQQSRQLDMIILPWIKLQYVNLPSLEAIV